jgi:type II secretory pathway pseudopilin PulG
MNHTDIEERQIAERYVLGQLPPDEAARFEEHYLSCPECLDRLELAESMERGFKRAAGQDAARLAAARQLAVVAWLARLGRSRQMAALVMAVLLVAVLPGLIALRQVRERDRELTAVRAVSEQERQQAAAASRTASETAKLRADLEASRRDLAREQEARTTTEEQLAAARQPQGNIPILSLDTERGESSAPSHRLRLPRSPGWIVLAGVVDPPHPPVCRAILRDVGGREVWRGDDLRLDNDSFSLGLHSSLLAPGDYILTVEAPGSRTAAGRFPFRVLPPA